MNDLFDRTDEELVALYAEGNNGAFDVLLKRHQVRTFNYIYYIVKDKELANDIFQETFVKAIMTIKQGRYTENGKFPAWISRIAHNLIIQNQIEADVRKLIKALPHSQREVLVMRYYKNMSFKEIADHTKVSINTALGRMRYAILNLRKMAEENNIVLTL